LANISLIGIKANDYGDGARRDPVAPSDHRVGRSAAILFAAKRR
jgi:hypothetical protein